MGYSYFMTGPYRGKLVCDVCGDRPGRKYDCPYHYCPKIAACKECRATRKELFAKESHADCEISNALWTANIKLRNDLMSAGVPVRCSAMSQDDGKVLVCFESVNGEEWHKMDPETYRALPLGWTHTLQDYMGVAYAMGHNPLTEGPKGFYSKEVR